MIRIKKQKRDGAATSDDTYIVYLDGVSVGWIYMQHEFSFYEDEMHNGWYPWSVEAEGARDYLPWGVSRRRGESKAQLIHRAAHMLVWDYLNPNQD